MRDRVERLLEVH